MYAMTPRCHLPPLRRAPPPSRAASTASPPALTTTPSPASTASPPALTTTPPRRADPDELRSTWPQRAWTLAGAGAVVSSLSMSASLAAESGSFAEPLLAATAAYTLADLATGVYHWYVDNYGDASTPFFGSQIAAFQGHHHYPSTITRRDPCNNLHALARAVALALPAVDAAAALAGAPSAALAFGGVFAASVVLSQQSHAWAHDTRRRLPAGVEALQAAGVLVSRAQHAAHHRPPYSSNYCILSGAWNGLLDRHRVFEALEMVVFFRTGVRPRSWDSPEAAWMEHTGDAAATAGNDSLL